MRADTLDFRGVFGVVSSIEALRRLPRLFDDVKVIVGVSAVNSRDRDLSIGSIVRWMEGVLHVYGESKITLMYDFIEHMKKLPDPMLYSNLEIGDLDSKVKTSHRFAVA